MTQLTETQQNYLAVRCPHLLRVANGIKSNDAARGEEALERVWSLLRGSEELSTWRRDFADKVPRHIREPLGSLWQPLYSEINTAPNFKYERETRRDQLAKELKNFGGVERQSRANAESLRAQIRDLVSKDLAGLTTGPMQDLARELSTLETAKAQTQALTKKLEVYDAETIALLALHNEIEAERQARAKANAPEPILDAGELSVRRKAATRDPVRDQRNVALSASRVAAYLNE